MGVAQLGLRHRPPVLRHVVLVHEPDARAARALEGARQREVQDRQGLPPPEGARREGRPAPPPGARRGAHHAHQGAGRVHRRAGWRPLQAGHLPLLGLARGAVLINFKRTHVTSRELLWKMTKRTEMKVVSWRYFWS